MKVSVLIAMVILMCVMGAKSKDTNYKPSYSEDDIEYIDIFYRKADTENGYVYQYGGKITDKKAIEKILDKIEETKLHKSIYYIGEDYHIHYNTTFSIGMGMNDYSITVDDRYVIINGIHYATSKKQHNELVDLYVDIIKSSDEIEESGYKVE